MTTPPTTPLPRVLDPGSTLRLDPLDPATEAEIVHAWVVEDRASFWMMQDHTLEEVREIYQWIHDQPTHAAYLLKDDGVPVALFQTYDPRAEEVGEHLEVLAGDVGVHFMLAPASEVRHGFSARMIAFLLAHVFADPACRRVVAEPDARNDKAVALLDRLGFDLGERVRLSMKPAQLAFLTRATYEAETSRVFSKNTSA